MVRKMSTKGNEINFVLAEMWRRVRQCGWQGEGGEESARFGPYNWAPNRLESALGNGRRGTDSLLGDQ